MIVQKFGDYLKGCEIMKKIAVMVSGGIDSLVAFRYAQARYGKENTTGIFVNYKQPYFDKENEAVYSLFRKEVDEGEIKLVEADLCTYGLQNIPTVEKQEIFGRNLLMAFYGALLGDRVWLSILENELHASVPDKHPEFLHMCSALFTYTFKNLRNETVVETPFFEMTKSEVVHLGLMLGITKNQFKQTISCYDAEGKSCGKCLACFKRWVAWVNNGIEEEFAFQPYANDYANKIIPLMREKHPHYSKKRIRETHNALVKSGFVGVIKDGINGNELCKFPIAINTIAPEALRWAKEKENLNRIQTLAGNNREP